MEYFERKFDAEAMVVKAQVISVLDYRYRYALPERHIEPDELKHHNYIAAQALASAIIQFAEIRVVNDKFTPPHERFVEVKISMPYVRNKRINDVEQQLKSAQNEVSNYRRKISRLENDVDYHKAALVYEKLPFWSKWAMKFKRAWENI